MRVGLPMVLAAAVLGAAGALLVGKTSGWFDGDDGATPVVVEQTAPPTTAAPPPARPLPGNAFDPARIYEARAAGVVTIVAFFGSEQSSSAAQGSGFVVSADGVILTNSHVITTAGENDGPVRPATSVYVEFKDRDRVRARVVGWDVFDDVGVLRVDPKSHGLTPLPLGDSSRVRVGEPVAAIGSPFGKENSLAVGVVSATRRSIESLTSRYNLVDAIQMDAPINRGNSGGPLFDAAGRVIGINAQIRSASGTAEGVGFAVPINAARRSMAELIANGTVSYAYVGITTQDLIPSMARTFGYPVRHGALITSVRSGSPGSRAGLRGGDRERFFNGTTVTLGGDVIVAVDGRAVTGAEDVVREVTERLRPGRPAAFTIVRNGTKRTIRVLPGERDGAIG